MLTMHLWRLTSGGQVLLKSKDVNIEFFASQTHIDAFPHPRQSSKFIPQYFKSLKPQISADPTSGTVKRCVPFLDALTTGYIIPLWSDVNIRASNGELTIKFPENLPMQSSLSPHSYEQIQNHPLSDQPYGNVPLKWHNPWGIRTPKGWSCLFTSPLNHLQSQFKILDGVVDTDTYYNQVNFPFIWTGGDGDFVYPRGMPLVQVIPFKRTETKCSIVKQDEQKHASAGAKLGTALYNGYRRFFWHKR